MPVADAPAENPNKPMSIDEFIAWLGKKGVRATKSDSPPTVPGQKRPPEK
jgi:hypothetical protein